MPFSQREHNLTQWREQNGCVCEDRRPSADCPIPKHQAAAARRAAWIEENKK